MPHSRPLHGWASPASGVAGSCRALFLALALVAVALPAMAGSRSVTWYLDGSRVEQDLQVTGGYIEMSLPAAVQAGSLRVRPRGGARISRVQVVPVKPDHAVEKELIRLAEQQESLQDRLQALSVKEEIFKSAAKTQGGKAPRRTRTNPEPLTAIREGTDFAINRLEEVYRAKRRIERELKGLEKRQTALRQKGNGSGSMARIWLAGRQGQVQISYLTFGEGWQPRYDLRIGGAEAEIASWADLPRQEKGARVFVVPVRLVEASTAMAPLAVGQAPLSVGRLPVLSRQQEPGLQTVLTVVVRNETGTVLPAGTASGFWNGEFLGVAPLSGAKPGENLEVTFGR
ncbi:MAG: DUF4140 domain-containing protein [Geobacter sp.]|nr:DUF4140 domain-containing protein [Geobacter sp.]